MRFVLASTLCFGLLAPISPTAYAHAEQSLPSASAPAQVEAKPWRLPETGKFVRLANFSRPTSDWGAGHRGIDFVAPHELLAPHAGTISWVGLAFGVPTLVLTHQNATSEVFQPVCSELPTESRVNAGDSIATFCPSKREDHCSRLGCVHWSFRLVDGQYINPLRMVGLVAEARTSNQALG